MMCALASSVVGTGAGTSTKPTANACAIVSPNAKTAASTCTVSNPAARARCVADGATSTGAITAGTVTAASAHAIAITTASAATVSIASSSGITSAVAGLESGTVAVGSCAVLGIVAHAVSVRIHKRAAALGGPVTGGLRGPCGAATQRIACTLQPCGTRASPRALYLGVIRGARLRKQATGRCGRRGASPSARSLTDRRDAGCRHGRGRAKRHRSYQGDCGHAHTVILMHSFHLAPLSACQGRRLVLCGGFRPLHYQYEPGRHFLARDFKYFWTAKKRGEPTAMAFTPSQGASSFAQRADVCSATGTHSQPRDRGADRFLVSQTSARESSSRRTRATAPGTSGCRVQPYGERSH